jgi:hypothetical protein
MAHSDAFTTSKYRLFCMRTNKSGAVTSAAAASVTARYWTIREIAQETSMHGRQEKCLRTIVHGDSAATTRSVRSDRMFTATIRPGIWLLFRACVTLRQILALKMPRPPKHPRKAAAICGVYLSLLNCAIAQDVTSRPAAPAGIAERTIDADLERIRPLREVGTGIAPPPGELPADMAERRFATAPLITASAHGGRGWAESAYLWQAPALFYRPLYFEEPNLERYGHHAGCLLQPAFSAAHFLVAVPALPAQMVVKRPWNAAYPLGHASPGSSALWDRPW